MQQLKYLSIATWMPFPLQLRILTPVNLCSSWLGCLGRREMYFISINHPNDSFEFLPMKNDRYLGLMYNDRHIKGFSNSPRHKPSKRTKLSSTTQMASTCFLLSHQWLPDLRVFIEGGGKNMIRITVNKKFFWKMQHIHNSQWSYER